MDQQNRSDISWHCVQSAGTSLHCVQSAGTLWNCVQSADKMFISRAQSKDIVNTGDPRELDIFWMGSTQLVGRGGRQGGRHSFPLGWQWRLGQWPLFETCFPGTSFPVSETCRGPLALPIFQRVIFYLWGGIWNRVFTLTNPIRWIIWTKPSLRKFVRSIVSCWPVSWTI